MPSWKCMVRAGRELPLAKLILSSAKLAWRHNAEYSAAAPGYVQLTAIAFPKHGTVPAAIAATDGKWVVAGMDRQWPEADALRHDHAKKGLLLLVPRNRGMVPMDDAEVLIEKGRLGPGDIIAIHLVSKGVLYTDQAK